MNNDERMQRGNDMSDWGRRQFRAGWAFTKFSFAMFVLIFIVMALLGN